MNNADPAVGTMQDARGATHAMLYAGGTITHLNDVSDAPGPLVSAVGISDAGEIAATGADGTYDVFHGH